MAGDIRAKMEKVGELLAESPIAEEIKLILLESAEKLSEDDIDSLIVAFEREHVELAQIEALVKEHDEKIRQAEERSEDDLEITARKMIDEFLADAILREKLK